MKSKIFSLNTIVLALASAGFVSFAHAGPGDLYGEPAPASAAGRTIYVDHDTNYVNITGGDVVKFVVHGKEFVWNFDTASNINEVELNQLLPPGLLHHVVKVYLARNPDYTGA